MARMGSPFVYVAGDRLSVAELSAARIDGDLVEVGDAFMPADAIETPAIRAASLAQLVPANTALVGRSAAWVHGALLPLPERQSVQRAVAHRIGQPVDRRLVYSDQGLPADAVELCGGVAVTSAVYTTTDLARAGDDVAVRALCDAHPAPAVRVRDAYALLQAAGPLHHKRRGLAMLEALIDELRTT